MHHEKINILFVINQAKTNQKGVSPIYFRITINKVRKQFSTGLTINPKDWNSKKQLAESKLFDYSVLNSQLSLIKQKINNYYFKLQLENESVKIEDLIDAYFQKPTKKEDSVLSYFQKWLNKCNTVKWNECLSIITVPSVATTGNEFQTHTMYPPSLLIPS